ncbi:hypothetical protein BHAOGJBA_6379 [Methylobacterium hispanicum]|uniref:Uncharacterized protein n=1 Tax=Methylobacterium hispanicum TaxID=270350 RepID=A0AAV4ZYR8_9HYPH|nr:hypothetical protein BHAOGJBA_6379 [Methylobacterium hispanicum]
MPRVAWASGPEATARASATTIEKGAVSRICPLASVTRTTSPELVPARSGVPESVPSSASSRPKGRSPWASENA